MTNFWITYAPDDDITFIMMDYDNAKGYGEIECVGFFFGHPEDKETQDYIDEVKSMYKGAGY